MKNNKCSNISTPDQVVDHAYEHIVQQVIKENSLSVIEHAIQIDGLLQSYIKKSIAQLDVNYGSLDELNYIHKEVVDYLLGFLSGQDGYQYWEFNYSEMTAKHLSGMVVQFNFCECSGELSGKILGDIPEVLYWRDNPSVISGVLESGIDFVSSELFDLVNCCGGEHDQMIRH